MESTSFKMKGMTEQYLEEINSNEKQSYRFKLE
jgi:hypothetical protein